jgi:hypothetical protein
MGRKRCFSNAFPPRAKALVLTNSLCLSRQFLKGDEKRLGLAPLSMEPSPFPLSSRSKPAIMVNLQFHPGFPLIRRVIYIQ